MESPAVAPVRVWLHLERGPRVISFEVLPLRTESMGNSTTHLSCPNLILRLSVWGQRWFWRESLAMGQSPSNRSLSEWTEWRQGEWMRVVARTQSWRCRKQNTESESEKERRRKRGMTNYSLSTCRMHPSRKEEHSLLTLLSKYARLVRLCVPEKMLGGVW